MPESVLHWSAKESALGPGKDGQPAPGPHRKSVYLHSGQVHVSEEPCSVTTILGSCVAVCIWDPIQGAGGATHYLLPHRVRGDNSSLRFGSFAIEQLIKSLLSLGSPRHNLRSKLFGGACIFPGFKSVDEQLGSRNVEVAFRMLEQDGIPVITHDVGGPQGRKLVFNTDSGDAWVKLL